MNYTSLGKEYKKVSQIALGCMRINNLSMEELDSYIHTALELGINFFDHADIYGKGDCEERFGQILSQNKSKRDSMIIQSKCGIRNGYFDFSKEHILESVDGILQRLQIDYLDTLLLHRPDILMEPEEIASAFNTLQEAGKVKAFGVSNFNSMQMDLLQSAVTQPLVINQMQFSIMHTGMVDSAVLSNTKFAGAENRDGSILDYCRLKGVRLQAWSPFQYGCFEGVFIDNDKLFPKVNEVMDKMAQKYGITKSAIAVAWILRHPAQVQVIVGTTNQQRLTEICKACDVDMTREDWYEIYRGAGNLLP